VLPTPAQGEELTLDYMPEMAGLTGAAIDKKYSNVVDCRCGEEKCRGKTV
jgi:hypothetical protein